MRTAELEVVQEVANVLSSPLPGSIARTIDRIWGGPRVVSASGLAVYAQSDVRNVLGVTGGGPVLANGIRLCDACASHALPARVRPMIALARDTILEALAILRRGGSYGLTVGEFAARWPTRLKTPRKTLAGVGQVTGALVRYGLAQRSSGSRRARFSVTAAGEAFLADARGS